MTKNGRFLFFTILIYFLTMAMFTFIYSVRQPSIISINVTDYGFPFLWLRITTNTVGPENMRAGVNVVNFILDVLTYLVISLIAAYFLIRRSTRFSEISGRTGLVIVGILVAAYFSRLLSGAVHEVIGHWLWAKLLGAQGLNIDISWIGHGLTTWVGGLTPRETAVVVAAGIITSSIIGWAVIIYLYITRNKLHRNRYLRIPLLWIGSWLVLIQSGYMMLGGLTGFGDVGRLNELLNIPLDSFILVGFLLFVLSYISISLLFITDISSLFDESNRRLSLTLFWIIVPLLLVSFNLTYAYDIPYLTYAVVVVLSFVPILLSIAGYSLLKEIGNPSPS